MQRYFNNVINRTGDSVSGASVYVYLTGATTLATLYSDNGVTLEANPMTTDASGFFAFYTADGIYDLVISGAGINTYAISAVSIGPNNTDLSAPTGASLVGSNDGSSGSLWTTVQGFINKIIGSAGASVIGFLQSGTGAGYRTLQDKVREIVTVSVKDFSGVVGNNSNDDTVGINAAYTALATAGGGLAFWPDGTYKTSDSIVVPSNTETVFSPRAAIDPVALASFTPIAMPGYTFGCALFRNTNFATSTFDSNITYRGVRMVPSRKDYVWYGGMSWNGHGIDSRNVQNLKILNCYGENMADFSGTLHCNDVLEMGNWATGMSNSTYDFWEGCQNVRLISNFAYNTNNGANWDAVDTQNLGTFEANDFLAQGNHFAGGAAAGIFVSPLNATSTCRNVKLVGNTIDQLALTTPGYPNGIVMTAVTDALVLGNTLKRIGAGFTPIYIGADTWNSSSGVSVVDNTIEDSAIGANAYIAAFGTNHYIAGNKDVNSSCAGGTYIQADDTSTIVMPQQFHGSTTNYVLPQYAPGGVAPSPMEFRVDAANSRWYFRQPVKMSSALQSVSYGVTATGTNLATALPIVSVYTFVSAGAGAGVALPLISSPNIVGMEVVIWNNSGGNMTIYSQAADSIDSSPSVTIATSTKVRLVALTSGLWKTSGT